MADAGAPGQAQVRDSADDGCNQESDGQRPSQLLTPPSCSNGLQPDGFRFCSSCRSRQALFDFDPGVTDGLQALLPVLSQARAAVSESSPEPLPATLPVRFALQHRRQRVATVSPPKSLFPVSIS